MWRTRFVLLRWPCSCSLYHQESQTTSVCGTPQVCHICVLELWLCYSSWRCVLVLFLLKQILVIFLVLLSDIRFNSSSLCLLLAGLREAQAVGIKFTHRLKIRFFAMHGQHVAPIQVKLGVTNGHVGPLSSAKFHLNLHRGEGNAAPEYEIFPTFWYSRVARANTLVDF